MAAPIYDNSGTNNTTNVASISCTFTITTNANRICMVSVLEDDNRTVSTLTVGGVSATYLGRKIVGSGFEAIELWYLIAPSTGSQTATATFDANNGGYCIITAVTFYDAAQSSAVGTYADSSGNSTTPSLTITSATGERVFETIWHRTGQPGYSITGGQTDRVNVVTFSAEFATSDIAGAATVTPSSSHTNSNGWCVHGVSIKPVPDFTPTPMMHMMGLSGGII